MNIAKTHPVRYFGFESMHQIVPLLMPAFVLMDASSEFSELIDKAQSTDPKATPLDVLLDVCTLHHLPKLDLDGNTKWHTNPSKQDMAGLYLCQWAIRQLANNLRPVKWTMCVILSIQASM